MPTCECGCETEVRGRFAQGHNSKRTPNPDRYIVDEESNCWVWQGSQSGLGYGTLRYEKRYWAAHRFHYTQRYGPVPADADLHHLCHNRLCCNPDHLQLVLRDEHAGGAGHGTLLRKDIPEIRALRDQGWLQKDIATRFGVSRSHVSEILARKRWKAAA